MRERFIVASLVWGSMAQEKAEQSLDELESLIYTAGGIAVARVIQKREKPDPGYFFGRGKVSEIKRLADELGADALAIDASITPSQQRNLEKSLGIKILDRTAVILDIFATHATTLEGKLQVELAQLQYLLPRLTGMGTQLSRLGGGIGTRGPGETKLEVDRRRIRKRIQTLKKRLKKVEEHRQRIRSERRSKVFSVVLVGYTNAGKSTLLNALTRADVYSDDLLFATLDPTSRRVYLGDVLPEKKFPPEVEVVLTDTVGFIENLPTELIAAFHSTLEEVSDADLLLHVVNSAHPRLREQIKAVEETLEKIGAAHVKQITVMNQIDKLEENMLNRLKQEFPDAVFVSALKKEGLEELKKRIAREALALHHL